MLAGSRTAVRLCTSLDDLCVFSTYSAALDSDLAADDRVTSGGCEPVARAGGNLLLGEAP